MIFKLVHKTVETVPGVSFAGLGSEATDPWGYSGLIIVDCKALPPHPVMSNSRFLKSRLQNSSLESRTKKLTNDVGYDMKISDHDDKITEDSRYMHLQIHRQVYIVEYARESNKIAEKESDIQSWLD
ncbi:hypothetical protein SLA2020_425120 [Shorea laevis]